MNMHIKKAKIEVAVEGCIECGTRGSSGWQIERIVPVVIGNKRGEITLHICADCIRRRESETHQMKLIT